MLAINTEFVPATRTLPARIKAFTCNGHKIFAPHDHALGDAQRHLAAAQKLIREQMRHTPDSSTMVYGGTEKGYVFCWPQSTIAAVYQGLDSIEVVE